MDDGKQNGARLEHFTLRKRLSELGKAKPKPVRKIPAALGAMVLLGIEKAIAHTVVDIERIPKVSRLPDIVMCLRGKIDADSVAATARAQA